MANSVVYGCICVNYKGEILLVRGRLGSKWSLPKGHINDPNESGIVCARRELLEETGLIAPETYEGVLELRGGTYYIFRFEKEDMKSFQIHDTREIDMVEWKEVHNFPEISNIDVNLIRNLLKNTKFCSAKNILYSLCSDFAVNKIKQMCENITNSISNNLKMNSDKSYFYVYVL